MPFGLFKKNKKEPNLDLEPPAPPKSPSAMNMDSLGSESPPVPEPHAEEQKKQEKPKEIEESQLDINDLLSKKMGQESEQLQVAPSPQATESVEEKKEFSEEDFNLDKELHELESMMGEIEKGEAREGDVEGKTEKKKVPDAEAEPEQKDLSATFIVRWRNSEYFIKSTDLKEVLNEVEALSEYNNSCLELHKEIDMRLTKQRNETGRINELVNSSLNRVLASDEIVRGEE
jgi:hypothetical protein